VKVCGKIKDRLTKGWGILRTKAAKRPKNSNKYLSKIDLKIFLATNYTNNTNILRFGFIRDIRDIRG